LKKSRFKLVISCRSAATWWVHTAYDGHLCSSIYQFLIYSTFVLVICLAADKNGVSVSVTLNIKHQTNRLYRTNGLLKYRANWISD